MPVVSLNLSPTAYQAYLEWSKGRRASLMISNLIERHMARYLDHESVLRAREERRQAIIRAAYTHLEEE